MVRTSHEGGHRFLYMFWWFRELNIIFLTTSAIRTRGQCRQQRNPKHCFGHRAHRARQCLDVLVSMVPARSCSAAVLRAPPPVVVAVGAHTADALRWHIPAACLQAATALLPSSIRSRAVEPCQQQPAGSYMLHACSLLVRRLMFMRSLRCLSTTRSY